MFSFESIYEYYVMSRYRRSKRRRARDLREVLESERAKGALSNAYTLIKDKIQVPKNETPLVQSSMNEDPLEEAHQLLFEIKQAQLEAMTFFLVEIGACYVEDNEKKGESKKKEQANEKWQNEEFFAKKVTDKKIEFEAVPFENSISWKGWTRRLRRSMSL
ncbi:hypothetical protein JCGZ_23721 [Jatropha curcas]|uniref:Uncharacterized protein n=1 Tax=Jatropha curcas TaxID=180498 RepID=A0A067K0W1_JATCU|nr:hypothetical protein JCGZ_23721 [Jatropha curcas]